MRLLTPLRNSLRPLQDKSVDRLVHLPVLANEITQLLDPRDGQCFLDMTFGGGGHTKHLLNTHKKITIFALDRDPAAFERALVLSKSVSARQNGQKVIPLLGRFSELANLMRNLKVPLHYFDGAIMDLGVSSFQFEEGARGFSLKADGPLDMRMDASRFPNMPTAADVINSLDASDLAKIFKTYGEERHATKVAQAIVDSRFMMKSLNSTRELAALVGAVLGFGGSDKLGRTAHPATKVFQALRIFVNNELNEINYGIDLLSQYLKRGQRRDQDDPVMEERHDAGLLAAIAFHSLEDKLVKDHIMGFNGPKLSNPADYGVADHLIEEQKKNRKWSFYKQRFLCPSENEVFLNPRARSARLRCALRVG